MQAARTRATHRAADPPAPAPQDPKAVAAPRTPPRPTGRFEPLPSPAAIRRSLPVAEAAALCAPAAAPIPPGDVAGDAAARVPRQLSLF